MIKLDEQTERLLLGYLEGDLDEAERWRAEAELTRRPELARWVRAMRDDREALRDVADQDVPESVRETVDALREREALLGDAPAAPGLGGELGVAGRISPSSATSPRAGDRALRFRRWTIRLAAAAAVLLCAAVMVQSIVGTNLLNSVTPGGRGGEDLAMDTPNADALTRSAERASVSERRREALPGAMEESVASDDESPPAPAVAAAGQPQGELDSVPRLDGDASTLKESLVVPPLVGPVAEAEPRPASEEAGGLVDGAMSRPADAGPAELGDETLASAVGTDSFAQRSFDIGERDQASDAAALSLSRSAVPSAEPSAGEPEPALRVEVDTPNPALAYVDLQRWAVGNAAVVQSPDPAAEGVADGGERGSAVAGLATDAVDNRLGVREPSADAVQVVQLAVPADRVDALLTHLNDDGRQRVRLLSEGNDAVAQRGMAIDAHPQVQWVPAEPERLEAAGRRVRLESMAKDMTAMDRSSDSPPEPQRENDAASTLAGVDLAAMLRAQAPTVATRSLSEWLPEPAVTVELLLRQQPEARAEPTAAPMPATPAPADDAEGQP
ncbi:MAG: hypothetical protein AAGI54_07535 [Planctomycetota bacterium]